MCVCAQLCRECGHLAKPEADMPSDPAVLYLVLYLHIQDDRTR